MTTTLCTFLLQGTQSKKPYREDHWFFLISSRNLLEVSVALDSGILCNISAPLSISIWTAELLSCSASVKIISCVDYTYSFPLHFYIINHLKLVRGIINHLLLPFSIQLEDQHSPATSVNILSTVQTFEHNILFLSLPLYY